MALAQISVRPRNRPISVNATMKGSTFANAGPDTVYYGGSRDVTSATGTSIASGASATLTGTQYLVVADSADLAKVNVSATTPSGDLSTYTQTYSTASRTVPNATFVAPVTTAVTTTTPYGFVTQAQGDAVVTGAIANAADILALKKVVTALIDDLQAAGLVL